MDAEKFVQQVEKDIKQAFEHPNNGADALFQDIKEAWSMHLDKDHISKYENEINNKLHNEGILPNLEIVGLGSSDHKGDHANKKDYVLIEQKENDGHGHIQKEVFKVDSDGGIHQVKRDGSGHLVKDKDGTILTDDKPYNFNGKQYVPGAKTDKHTDVPDNPPQHKKGRHEHHQPVATTQTDGVKASDEEEWLRNHPIAGGRPDSSDK